MKRVLVVMVLAAFGCSTTASKIYGTTALTTMYAGELTLLAPVEADHRIATGVGLLVASGLACLLYLHAEANAPAEVPVASSDFGGVAADSGPGTGLPTGDDHLGTHYDDTSSWTPSHDLFDGRGAYAGRSDPQGNFYDGRGAYAGRRDDQGNYFTSTEAYGGRVDAQQNYYDGTGAYAGRRDDQGNFYDDRGAYGGRIDAQGNIYDKAGAYAGRVDGTCDDACKREATARILLAP